MFCTTLGHIFCRFPPSVTSKFSAYLYSVGFSSLLPRQAFPHTHNTGAHATGAHASECMHTSSTGRAHKAPSH